MVHLVKEFRHIKFLLIYVELIYSVNNYILITLSSSFPEPRVRFTRLCSHTGILSIDECKTFFFLFGSLIK